MLKVNINNLSSNTAWQFLIDFKQFNLSNSYMKVKCDVLVWTFQKIYSVGFENSESLHFKWMRIYWSKNHKILNFYRSFESKIQFPTEEKGLFEFFFTSKMIPAIFKSKHFHFLPFLIFVCIGRLPSAILDAISPKISRKIKIFTTNNPILTLELSEKRFLTIRQRRMRKI